jgi:tight adherence protein B
VDSLLLIAALVGFLAVVLLSEGGYLLWNAHHGQEARRIQSRLRLLSAGGRLSGESELVRERLLSSAPAVERFLLGVPRVHVLDRLLVQSGGALTVGGLFAWTAGAAIAGFFAWLLSPVPAWMAPPIVAGAGAVPMLLVLRRRTRRLWAIERQLPDTLDLMSRAMRAGHAFPSALQMAGSEAPEPIAGEFRITADEVNYGVSAQDALGNLGTRVPLTDLRFFVVAVAIQRETGGNLAELLDKLAALIRERLTLLGKVRVLSSEGRLSAWILSILPFALVALINLINPKFMSLLWRDSAGLMAIWIGLGLMGLGIVWMWRTIRIRV